MKKSEKEISAIKKQNVFILEKLILQGEASLQDISQQFSGIIHLNNLNTFAWDWLPNDIVNRYEVDVEEESKYSLEHFATKHIHPLSIKQVGPLFYNASENKSAKPFEAFQYIKINDQAEYVWVQQTCMFSFKLGNIISISHFVKGADYEIDHGEKLIEEYNFLRKNFDKFMMLTSRQKYILKLLALGYTNQAISHELQISSNTVRTHRNDIHRVLDLRWKNINHSQVYFMYAFHFGLI